MTNAKKATYAAQRRVGDAAKKTLAKAKAAKPVEHKARANPRYLTRADGVETFNIYEMLVHRTSRTVRNLPFAYKLATYQYLVAVRQASLSELANAAATCATRINETQLRQEIAVYSDAAEGCKTQLENLYYGSELAEQLQHAKRWTAYGLEKKQQHDDWHVNYVAAKAAEAEAAKAEAAKAQPAQPAQPVPKRSLGNIKTKIADFFGSADIFDCAREVVVLNV